MEKPRIKAQWRMMLVSGGILDGVYRVSLTSTPWEK
jgi:hypothetical protein